MQKYNVGSSFERTTIENLQKLTDLYSCRNRLFLKMQRGICSAKPKLDLPEYIVISDDTYFQWHINPSWKRSIGWRMKFFIRPKPLLQKRGSVGREMDDIKRASNRKNDQYEITIPEGESWLAIWSGSTIRNDVEVFTQNCSTLGKVFTSLSKGLMI